MMWPFRRRRKRPPGSQPWLIMALTMWVQSMGVNPSSIKVLYIWETVQGAWALKVKAPYPKSDRENDFLITFANGQFVASSFVNAIEQFWKLAPANSNDDKDNLEKWRLN